MEKWSVACGVVTAVVVYIIYNVMINLVRLGRLYKQTLKFEGPPGLPFIGNAHLFIGGYEAILNRFVQLGKTYPKLYRLWIGYRLFFVTNTPEQVQMVLLSPKTIERSDLTDFAKPWIGAGLLTAPAAKWRVHRRLIQPTFHSDILRSFVEIFANQSSIMAKQIQTNLNGPEFDIRNYISLSLLSSICETSMGVRSDAQTYSENYYADAVESLLQSICQRFVKPWLYPNFIFLRSQLAKEQQKYISILHTFTDNVIETKKKELLERSSRFGVADGEDDKGKPEPRRKAFLDHLIELSNESGTLSDEEVREEVDTMIVAGFYATARTISFVMLMLASYPEIQEKVYEELCEIYGKDVSEEVNVGSEDLTRMVYLERVIKETLRLFPTTPILMRTVMEDLDIGKRTLPKGSTVLLGIMEIHRNPDYWPDPLKFDPDRFLPEEVEKRHPYAYLPFSAGPRGCIGLKYAMLSMKTLISTILRRYVLKKDHITPVKDIRLQVDLLLKPVSPILLKIEKRTQRQHLSD